MNPLPDTFNNPQLWPLLLFAILPALLYFIDRRRARRIDWPALRFFLNRQKGKLRWMRLREALLISVRTLALALIVYALLGPVSLVEKELGTDSTSSRGLVLAFDTSFSMSYRPDGEPGNLLERAKTRGRRLLAQLKPGDAALLLDPARPAEEAASELFSREKNHAELEEISLGARRFELLHAIDDAIEGASRLPSTVREIYIFTDFQAHSLGRAGEGSLDFLASRLRALDPIPTIELVDCGAAEPRNHRVIELESDSLATGTSSPVGLRVKVAPAPGTEGLQLRITVNGEVLSSQPLPPVKPGSPALEILSSHRFSSAGNARVSAEIVGEDAGDGLRADDARHLVIEVLDRLEVPIIQENPDSGRADGGHWIDLALFPRYGETNPPEVIFRPAIMKSISGEILERSRVIILSEIQPMKPAELRLIEDFVSRGGGLLIFAGEKTDRDFANGRLWREGRGLMPARLVEKRKTAAGETLHPLQTDLEHPVFSIFKGVSEGELARVSIRSYWQAGAPGENAAVLSRTTVELPWIIERPRGTGKTILFLTSASPADTDLPRTPLFVPLLHRMVRYLALGPSSSLACEQGRPIDLALDTAETAGKVRVTPPGGESSLVDTSEFKGKPAFSWKSTRETGFYSFDFSKGNGSRRSEIRAVNTNPEESDLRRLEEDTRQKVAEALGGRLGSHSQESTSSLQTAVVELEHWPYALLLGLALLVAELLLLRGMRSSKTAEPAGGAA